MDQSGTPLDVLTSMSRPDRPLKRGRNQRGGTSQTGRWGSRNPHHHRPATSSGSDRSHPHPSSRPRGPHRSRVSPQSSRSPDWAQQAIQRERRPDRDPQPERGGEGTIPGTTEDPSQQEDSHPADSRAPLRGKLPSHMVRIGKNSYCRGTRGRAITGGRSTP